MPDVVLVQMPFAAIEHPSIAIGILTAILEREGISCRGLYAHLDFCEQVGYEPYRLSDFTPSDHLVGEWIFAGAAFPDHEPDHAAYVTDVSCTSSLWIGRTAEDLRDTMWDLRNAASAFIEATARRVVAMNPRIVGASSSFQQHTASLALLRRVRALDPSIVTMLGGANCEGEMGVATRRNFPWVDFVVSGEADEVFAPLCRRVLEHGRQVPTAQLPAGVLGADPMTWVQAADGEAPRARVAALDAIPTPCYDDWFEALANSAISKQVVPGLLVETSRGCWWGQKHHCTFCGLNGVGIGYRAKSAARVLDEFESLSTRYRVPRFEVVDNILDNGHMRTVIPALAERQRPYTFFYETKSNLKREQVRLLADAGVYWIQPGIENLCDEVLKLMDKGTDALSNIELLKWSREFGVHVIWNFLLNFPGEDDAWYTEMAEWLPLISHLQPPVGAMKVRYDRFSPYHERPERYGIEIRANHRYASVYPLPPEELEKLAYFFEDVPEQRARPDRQMKSPGRWALRLAIDKWIRLFTKAELPTLLSVSDDGQVIHVLDTRPVALARRRDIDGVARLVYQACETAQTPASALAKVRKTLPEASEASVQDALDSLVQQRLVLTLRGRYLALGVHGSIPSLQPMSEFPGGSARVDPKTAERIGPRPLWPPAARSVDAEGDSARSTEARV